MKKIIQLILVFMLIIAGGCGMSKEKENGKIDASSMPETEAFQDEFTRGFMASSEEVVHLNQRQRDIRCCFL
ncbi:hypothetical protein [Metabacillus idriensis]|uniref:hypothetical protein n=1 Tax=Metabacillus idriensis TaxID=324768 RepID=UPI0017483BCF|nr:hypothetical protein [Metabacillus idriensis]